MERISFKRIHREKYASLRDPINGYSGENSRFIRPSRFVSQPAPRFHRSVSRRRVIGYYCAGTCDERSPIPKGYYSTAIRCVVISVFIRLRRINASQQLSFSSVNSVERNFERYASLRKFILLVVPVSFPASSSVCFLFFLVFLYVLHLQDFFIDSFSTSLSTFVFPRFSAFPSCASLSSPRSLIIENST